MNEDSGIQIQEIVSRCLVDPPFLEFMMADLDRAIAPYGLDPRLLPQIRTLDLRRMKMFSGFIGKVQHNHLWDILPATRRLLELYGVELEVFGSFRSIQLSTRAQSRAAQLENFVGFVSRYAKPRPQFAALDCAARYEHLAWTLGTRAGDAGKARQPRPSAAADCSWSAFQKLIPVPSGCYSIGRFGCDPGQLVTGILDGSFTDYREANPKLFLFQAEAAGSGIRCFEIDELTALILSLIDGRRTVRSVISAARARTISAAKPRSFREFFGEAVSAGLILVGKGASP
jgi:hypothetical protein